MSTELTRSEVVGIVDERLAAFVRALYQQRGITVADGVRWSKALRDLATLTAEAAQQEPPAQHEFRCNGYRDGAGIRRAHALNGPDPVPCDWTGGGAPECDCKTCGLPYSDPVHHKESKTDCGGVEGHASYLPTATAPVDAAGMQDRAVAKSGDAVCSAEPMTMGAGIKPGPQSSSPTSGETPTDIWLVAEMRNALGDAEEMLSAIVSMLCADATGDHEKGLARLNSNELARRVDVCRDVLSRLPAAPVDDPAPTPHETGTVAALPDEPQLSSDSRQCCGICGKYISTRDYHILLDAFRACRRAAEAAQRERDEMRAELVKAEAAAAWFGDEPPEPESSQPSPSPTEPTCVGCTEDRYGALTYSNCPRHGMPGRATEPSPGAQGMALPPLETVAHIRVGKNRGRVHLSALWAWQKGMEAGSEHPLVLRSVAEQREAVLKAAFAAGAAEQREKDAETMERLPYIGDALAKHLRGERERCRYCRAFLDDGEHGEGQCVTSTENPMLDL